MTFMKIQLKLATEGKLSTGSYLNPIFILNIY